MEWVFIKSARHRPRTEVFGAAKAKGELSADRKKAQAARIGGAVMVVGGALEVVAAGAIATTCQTGFTCAAAGAIAFSGADNAGTGIAMLWTGEQQTTIGANILLGLMNAVIRYIRFE